MKKLFTFFLALLCTVSLVFAGSLGSSPDDKSATHAYACVLNAEVPSHEIKATNLYSYHVVVKNSCESFDAYLDSQFKRYSLIHYAPRTKAYYTKHLSTFYKTSKKLVANRDSYHNRSSNKAIFYFSAFRF